MNKPIGREVCQSCEKEEATIRLCRRCNEKDRDKLERVGAESEHFAMLTAVERWESLLTDEQRVMVEPLVAALRDKTYEGSLLTEPHMQP